MTGTIITISSNSWLGAWIGLEINLLSFIPLISDNNRNNLISTEASLKYFLIQAIASTVLLFAVIIILLESAIIINLIIYSKSIILSSLLLKRGTAPFHFWFPNVMEGISWINALILMTWQKIAPIILISYVLIYPLLRFRIILSVIIGSLGGLNQTSIRKLMAFSSINHLGWILAAIIYRESLWLIYLLIYSTLLINLTLLFNIFKISHINQLFSLFFKNNNLKFILSINLLSLGGLPPFLGFLPKWLVIQANVLNQQYFIITLIVFIALVTLFFYLRLCYTSFILNYTENSWNYESHFNKNQIIIYYLFTFISIFGLSFISIFYFIL